MNKVYGLIGFAGVMGAVALVTGSTACSSSSTSSSSGDTGSDGGSSGTSGKTDGGSSSGKTDGGSSSGSSDCPVATVDPASLNDFYKVGTDPTPGACSAADIAAITGKTTIKDIVTALDGVQASCKTCALTADGAAAAKWAPLVTVNSGGSAVTIPNWGACVGGKSSAACGELEQKFQLCFLAACDKCADADFDACRDAAYDGNDAVCQKMAADLQAKNGCDVNAYQKANSACGTDVIKHISAHCGAGGSDAGKD